MECGKKGSCEWVLLCNFFVVFLVVFARLPAVLRKRLHSNPRVLVYRFDMKCGSSGTFFYKICAKKWNFCPGGQVRLHAHPAGSPFRRCVLRWQSHSQQSFWGKGECIELQCEQSSICGTYILRLKIVQTFFSKVFLGRSHAFRTFLQALVKKPALLKKVRDCIAPVVWSFSSTTAQLYATHRKRE
jgi:hypothetical protein